MRLKTDTFRENSTFLIDEIVAPLNEARIPFSSTQGVSKDWKATSLMHLMVLKFVRIIEPWQSSQHHPPWRNFSRTASRPLELHKVVSRRCRRCWRTRKLLGSSKLFRPLRKLSNIDDNIFIKIYRNLKGKFFPPSSTWTSTNDCRLCTGSCSVVFRLTGWVCIVTLSIILERCSNVFL